MANARHRAQTFKIEDKLGGGLMLVEGGVDSHHAFQFHSPLSPLQSQIQGDGVDLPASAHAPWQQASLGHSQVSCPGLITFRGFLLPSVKSPHSLGWLAKPSGPAFSCLSSIISCYTSPHSSHLHQCCGIDLSPYLTSSSSGSLNLPVSPLLDPNLRRSPSSTLPG